MVESSQESVKSVDELYMEKSNVNSGLLNSSIMSLHALPQYSDAVAYR